MRRNANGVDVARARLRKLRAGFGSNGLRRRVAGEKINVERVLGNFRRGGIHAGKPIVIVLDVEAAVLGNDGPAGEEIRAEPFLLPAQFYGIENAADVVPAKCADETFFAVTQFLAADFERKRKLLMIAQSDIGLVQVDDVGFRPVAFARDSSGDGGRLA